MGILETLLATLAPSVAKSLLKLWLADSEIAASAGQSLVDMISKKLTNVLERNSAERQIVGISEQVVARLEPLMRDARIRSIDVPVITRAMTETLDATPVNAELVSKRNMSPAALAEFMMDTYPVATQGMGDSQKALYVRAMQDLSSHLVRLSFDLPTTLGDLLNRVDEIPKILKGIFEDFERAREQSRQNSTSEEARRFEERYRDATRNRLDRVQLFGIDGLSSHSKRHRLSAAYVPLEFIKDKHEISANFTTEGELESWNKNPEFTLISAQQLLKVCGRIIVRGQAGLGKTTFLSWLATQIATSGFEEPLSELNQKVPFYVRLRDFVDEALPRPEQFPTLIAPEIAEEMPRHWTHEQLRSGRGLILVDGLDELPEKKRDDVRNWLDSLSTSFPDSTYIVTSRPTALEEGWLSGEGFTTVDLKPLDEEGIDACIRKWHVALAEVLGDEADRDLINEKRNALLEQVFSSSSLSDLSSRPLLCAAICALNWDKHKVPTNLIELYDDLVAMLLSARDEQRRLDFGGDYPRLELNERRMLISDIAFYMMSNGHSTIDRMQVITRIEALLKDHLTLNSVEPIKACKLLVDRTGTLQAPTIDSLEFSHRSLQEYLTAGIASRDDYSGLLSNNASDPRWYDTIVFTAGIAAKQNTAAHNRLVERLLERVRKENNKTLKRSIAFLALRCWTEGGRRNQVLQALFNPYLELLTPLNHYEEAAQVASLGDMIVPFLQHVQHPNAMLSAYALIMIGSEEAVRQLKSFPLNGNFVGEVYVFSQFFEREYIIDEVLLPKSPISIHLSQPGVPLQKLKQFESLESISIFGFFGKPEEGQQLDVLQEMPKLKTLNIRRYYHNDVSPTFPFPELQNLQNLSIDNPLSQTTLNKLAPKVGNLFSLRLNGDDTVTNLDFLNTIGEALASISLEGFQNVANLDLITKFDLRSLDLSGFESIDSLSFLKSLSNLNSLTLQNLKQVQTLEFGTHHNLSRLTINGLPNIHRLVISPISHSIEVLYIGSSSKITEISGLNEAQNLKNLGIQNISCLQAKSDLRESFSLTTLNIQEMYSHQDLDLFDLDEVTHLSMGKINIDSTLIEKLNNLPKLEHLSILRGTQRDELSGLSDRIEINFVHHSGVFFLNNLPQQSW